VGTLYGKVVVINEETANDNDIKLGDVIILDLGKYGTDEWQVIGLYQMIVGGSFSSDDLYAPDDAVFAAMKEHSIAMLKFRQTTIRAYSSLGGFIKNVAQHGHQQSKAGDDNQLKAYWEKFRKTRRIPH
jgi:hypothetical protein